MSVPRSPASTRILELLADGHWHDREEIIAAALLPPGRAWRSAERLRLRGRAISPRTHGTRDTAIASGRRTYGRDTLWTLISHGHVILQGDKVRAAP
jgi:hypothetical protein